MQVNWFILWAARNKVNYDSTGYGFTFGKLSFGPIAWKLEFLRHCMVRVFIKSYPESDWKEDGIFHYKTVLKNLNSFL